jgi:hypothetical protein
MKHYTINGKDLHHLNHTMIDALPVIFAAFATSTFDSTTNVMRHDVDAANLKELASDADTAMHGLIDAVRAIGGLLSYVDHKEIEGTVNSIGWVLSGIAGIAQNVHDAGVAFNEDLRSRKA